LAAPAELSETLAQGLVASAERALLGLGRDEHAADFQPLETARHQAACEDGRADHEGDPDAAQEASRHDHAEG
jgi:hypothetical protein